MSNDADDSVTVTSTEGMGSRFGGSIAGVLIGIVLIVGSIVLLTWNEGRAVRASGALAEGARAVVEGNIATPVRADEGKLVHVTGMMETKVPPRDPAFGAAGDGVLRLDRKVEMYQWKETESSESQTNLGGGKTTTTTYKYSKEWSDQPLNSSSFHAATNHKNPPMPITSASFTSEAVTLGAYRVDPAVVAALSDAVQVAPPAGTTADYHADGDHLYRGRDPNDPAIGDIRVGFRAIRAQTASVVAAQSGNVLAPYRGENGYTIALAQPGIVPAAEEFREQRQKESIFTWILRGSGFVAMLIGFMLIMQPLSVLASVIPPLGAMMNAGAFLVALGLALPLTLLVIAVAWLAHRPLVAVALILTGIAVPVGLHRLHRRSAQIVGRPA